ncbi:hypothetical protein [Zoogloea sp.]|uniref:hypothetical protein n=1 Tax=Zoogloea sp. TaxID=49181 RepID=UPI0035ADF252
MSHNRSITWLRLGVLYFAFAVGVGIAMGAYGNHLLMPVHAHLNLLGWVSMALFALIGHLYPAVHQGPLATVQFWTYNIGVPVMLTALVLRLNGVAAAEPVIGFASVAIGVSVALFGWLVVLTRARPMRAPSSATMHADIAPSALAAR